MTAWEAHSLSVLTDGRFEMGVGTGRPGIEDELRERGLPVVPPGERLAQVRETVRALRDLDGPRDHTPVAMAVRGPKAQALAADLADTVTFAQLPGEPRAEVARLARDFRAIRDVELANHVSVIGDTRAPFMAPPDTDPAALRTADSLAILPDDPAAAAEEIQRRREEIGFSYFVFGADSADALAPVVAKRRRTVSLPPLARVPQRHRLRSAVVISVVAVFSMDRSRPVYSRSKLSKLVSSHSRSAAWPAVTSARSASWSARR